LSCKELKIKVCGLKKEPNIQAIAALPVDFLGFIHYKGSKRFVGKGFTLPQLSTKQKLTAVLVNEPLSKAVEVFKQGYDFLQLHGDETAAYCKKLSEKGIPIIKAFGISDDFDFNSLQDYLPYVKRFLFDTKSNRYGGSGKKFDWKNLQNYTLAIPFFLSGGITKDDFQEILDFSHPRLFGIDLNSGFEKAPGIKNTNDLKVFLSKIT